jgi:type VI secretion system protein ImpI
MFVLRAYQSDNTPLTAERYRFPHLPIRIGRNPLNDYSLQHPVVSSFHARIEEIEGKICIRDLGSRNGVYVPAPSGAGSARVEANASIDLGPVGFRFYLAGSILVKLEFVEEEEPVPSRRSAKAGSVLGNAGMIGQSAQPVPQAPIRSAPAPAWASSSPAVQAPAAPPVVPIAAPVPPRQGLLPSPGAAQVAPAAMGPRQPGRVDTSGSLPASVELDVLALQGLRELARSLIPGRTLDTTTDVARLITKLHDLVEVFCRCFIPLRQGYSQFVSSLDLSSGPSINRSPAAVALELATSPEAIAVALLDPRDPSFDAGQAVEGILADLVLHQVALLDGVMQGVRALLDELSPENIEAALAQHGAAALFGAKHRACWTEYCERFARISDEREAFAVIFGKDFAEAYRQYQRRGRAEHHGTEAPGG